MGSGKLPHLQSGTPLFFPVTKPLVTLVWTQCLSATRATCQNKKGPQTACLTTGTVAGSEGDWVSLKPFV